ncbi:glycosyltransferase [Nesterenkonia halotolerans]|uniref:glycosyltransferase n=1 Tax=Nesterenkonia halotolerans TaxID=225325 RepID=UPI003EE7214D
MLESLGVSAASPFLGGRLRGADLETELADALADLPCLEPGISKPALDLTVAVFGDESLHTAFRGSADLTEIDPFDWEAGVQNAQAIMLGPRSARSPRARGKVINAARELSLPLIFTDLGVDAPRPDQLTLAGRCDHIFAVSEENAERYRSTAPRGTSVGLIASPISPLHRSPVGSQRMTHPLVTYFQHAGAKLGTDVVESLEWILDGVAAAGPGLLISPGHRPERPLQVRHWPYAQDWAFDRSAELDRLSDIGVVAHEISGSQTAFSARAIELQASGSMVLSTYNQGINSYYPQIHVANSTEDVATMLDSLEIKDLRRNQSDGLRQVFTENHASDVFRHMLEHAGVSATLSPTKVLAVVEEHDDSLLAEMSAQSAGAVETVTWHEAWERHGQYDVLLPVSSGHHYSPTYVADHLAALSYQSAPVVTKHSDPSAPGHVHTEAHTGSLALTAWWCPEKALVVGTRAMHRQLSETRVYLADGFGHRERKIGQSRRTPTLLAAGDDFDKVSAEIGRTAKEGNLQLSVVVPIYNNGPHLRHKAFASLLRSSAFNEMHVLLVSDGSTDPLTLDIIEDLVEDYPNVSSFHHSRGGSGSASRPRNTGLDLAQTPYVTYLDPDNEAIDNGYAQLYEQIRAHPAVDFVLGNMSQWAKRRTMLPYAEVLRELFADDVDTEGNISVPQRALESLRFRPMGIQTVIARTDWLKSLNLTQPVGAVGQDSYFFQQMLHYATSVRTVDVGVHTYYMVVSNSTVNTINPNYFKKYLPLDKARAHWLSQVGLLEAYKEQRLESFLVSWLLPKLRRIREDEWYEAAENLAELLNYYGDYRWTQPTALDFWDDLRRARAHRAKSER